jgi:glycine betaine/choline ABC-type transport system substrate-binding protein
MPEFLSALNSLADTIDAEAMRLANQHVDGEGGTVEAAAQVLRR